MNDIGELLDAYFKGSGPAHLLAESRLRALNPAAVREAYAQRSEDPDPTTPLLARTLFTWTEGEKNRFETSLAHMERMETREVEGSEALGPRADEFADDIAHLQGDKAVPLFATRLMKQSDWPSWKIAGALMYLGMEKDPDALPALIRFASENDEPVIDDMVAKTLEAFDAEATMQAWRNEINYQAERARGRDS
jgi:hypothetical protein